MSVCNNCIHKPVCAKFTATGGHVKECEHFERAIGSISVNMCKYCDSKNNDFIPLNNTIDYSGIEMSLNRQGMLRVRYYDINDPNFVTQDIMNVKYCPICGKKLKGE